jgi:rSAM/selenodomain-associated transferase 2
MTPSDISVIIPTWNEEGNLPGAIESAWNGGAGEVIVSDGGSEDTTCAIAEQLGAKLIRSERGRGQQLNTACLHAGGAVLLFLHADNMLASDCLTAVCERIAAEGRTLDQVWGGFQQRIAANGWKYRLLEFGNAARIQLRGMPFGDQAMFASRSMLDLVGNVRPLPLMEDVDLAKRCRRRSWPLLIRARVHVDPRRWERRGVICQTLKNWSIQAAHFAGVSEQKLADWYR